ncbi:MAG: STAS-like domain-containing protein [Patescibacteria group bacterium]
MILELKKFGKILNSRSSGREAVLRARQIINGNKDAQEELILDFKEVDIVTPSFADEFITGLTKEYPRKNLKIQGTEGNTVTKDVLKLININKILKSRTT